VAEAARETPRETPSDTTREAAHDPTGTAPRSGHRASLRLRITVAAVLAVALTLGVFTLVFALVQRAVLDDVPRSSAQADADRVVSAIEAGTSPVTAAAGDADDGAVLVVDRTGALLAAGGDDDLLEHLTDGSVGDPASLGSTARIDGDRYVVETESAVRPDDDASGSASDTDVDDSEDADDPDDTDDTDDTDDETGTAADDSTSTSADADPAATVTVVAVRSLEEARAASSASLVTLGVAIPVALLVLGITTWLVVGRALRPVEAMRREVDAVTAAQLDRRVADPGGSDEVARLARTLNVMLARLESSAAAQRRFVGDASHELKTPLATIRQHAEVALLHPESIDGPALAGTVMTEEARLTALVQGLLVLARADEGALGVTRRPVDLDDLVVAETSRLRSAAPSLAVDATGVGPARVEGDEGLLGQVVRNLLANASRHAATRISVGLVERQGRAVLTVDDDGAGVPEAERERVFDRFVRLDEARTRDSGGSGLGLAIVREIARVHGGTVTVDSSPLGGARFVVDLPAGLL
jgi:signal transduction histidine kinase